MLVIQTRPAFVGDVGSWGNGTRLNLMKPLRRQKGGIASLPLLLAGGAMGYDMGNGGKYRKYITKKVKDFHQKVQNGGMYGGRRKYKREAAAAPYDVKLQWLAKARMAKMKNAQRRRQFFQKGGVMLNQPSRSNSFSQMVNSTSGGSSAPGFLKALEETHLGRGLGDIALQTLRSYLNSTT